jgi:DNA-binding LacI/PurR family transcriptional regulator
VPGDVAVVGIDDSGVARQTDPTLTTVRQPIEQMGREMARLLVARIAGEEPEQPFAVLDTTIVIRESA